jgi:hypothetical protein
MSTYHLTELQYSDDLKGPWALYIYGLSGYHSGAQWFARKIRYPDEEITITEAKKRMKDAMRACAEIRVCDSGDMLVFHAQNGKVLHGDNFWKDITEEK